MRCRTCDYPLWTIEARTCPKCGTGFAPSEFEFRPGAVRFECPTCRQEYYGTSAKGHLEPTNFECVRCGHGIAMDEMVLVPAAGFDEDSAATPPNPWVERGRIGFWRAWFRSVRGILGAPSNFAKSIGHDEPVGQSLRFLFVTVLLTSIMSFAFSVVSVLLLFAFAGPPGAGMPVSMMVLQQGLGSLIGLAAAVAISVVWCLGSHLVLRIVGGARGGWRTTLRTLLYTLGATNSLNLVACVPCVGIIALVWWIVSGSIMLRVVHRTTTGKALAAVLLPSALSIALLVAAIGGFAFWVATVTAGQARALAVRPQPAIAMSAAALDAWPRTPLDAVADGLLGGTEPLDDIAPEDPAAMIEGLNRDELVFGRPGQTRLAADRLAKRVPTLAPYRLGELAIVWPGTPTDDPSLWLMIARRRDGYFVVDGRGRHGPFPRAAFEALLAAENQRRTGSLAPAIDAFDDLPLVPLAE